VLIQSEHLWSCCPNKKKKLGVPRVLKDADYLLATELAHLERAARMSTLNLDKPQLLTATVHGIQVCFLQTSLARIALDRGEPHMSI
jgi:hypothetical protein